MHSTQSHSQLLPCEWIHYQGTLATTGSLSSPIQVHSMVRQFLTSQRYYCPAEVQLEHCWGLSPQETQTGPLLGGLAVWAVGKHSAAGFKA